MAKDNLIVWFLEQKAKEKTLLKESLFWQKILILK